MDQFLFDQHLQDCTTVQEKTTCFETFLYADPEYRTTVTEETILEIEEFDDFLDQKGRFENKNQGCIGGIRLILQGNAIHPNTFEPKFLSLPKGFHKKMVDAMHLPHSWIETLSAVGPFYWSGYEQNENDLYLQIIYRKSDLEKATEARDWELVLSYSLKTGITNAFLKGTPRSDIARCITCLRECIGEIDHPLFLPALVFLGDIDLGEDKLHRDNRERVRALEKEVIETSHKFTDKDFTNLYDVSLLQMYSNFVDCHKSVLWNRPEGYITIVQKMEKTLSDFKILWPDKRKERLRKIQIMMEGRLELLQSRLQGISTHSEVTISRLRLIGDMLGNLVSLDFYKQDKQRNFVKVKMRKTARLREIGDQELKLKEKTQNRELEIMLETRKQTTMSLLGIVFLPGTFFAAIFSTTFFNFQHGVNAGIVSKKFYVYWAATIPTTMTMLCMWLLWQRKTQKMLEKRDEKLREIEEQSKEARNDIFREEVNYWRPG